MFCQFCKVEIPASWARVIASNLCPACGESIISEESKKIMDELKDAITKMSASPEELASWLMSTYDLFPKGTIEPTTFHRKPTGHDVVQEDTSGIKWANTPTNQFKKRAGVDKIMKDPKLAAIAQAINNINSLDGQMYGGPPEPEQDLEQTSPEEQEAAEQQHIANLAARARAQGRKLTMKEVLANSTEFNMGGDTRPLSEAETELVKHMVGGPSMEEDDMAGIQNLPPMLQADRLKRLAAQRELKFSGSSGLIKRSSD